MIEAQEVLINMRLADYPNMKKDDRSKWHGQLNRQAYPRDDDSKPLSSEEASAIIGALLNG